MLWIPIWSCDAWVTWISVSLSEALCWHSATSDMKRLSLFNASRVAVRKASCCRIVFVVLKNKINKQWYQCRKWQSSKFLFVYHVVNRVCRLVCRTQKHKTNYFEVALKSLACPSTVGICIWNIWITGTSELKIFTSPIFRCLVFKWWSNIQMAFEYQTIWRKDNLSPFRWLSTIQIPNSLVLRS